MTQHPKRGTHMSRHHLVPKIRGGHLVPSNTLRLWRDNHNFWHQLFNNRTLPEVITFLHNYRSQELKRKYESPAWKKLFGDKTLKEVIIILKRIKRIKSKL
jgi:hypothetical protein